MLKSLSPAAALVSTLLAPGPVAAAEFDYYLLALSWSPSWCLDAGDPEHEQCTPGRALGFTLHGLWPQFDEGWPEDCATPHADPSRRETAAMADIMGSGGLAWHQWKKHGRCSGLSSADYFEAARAAYEALDLAVPEGSRTTAAALEAAFIEANPDFAADGVIVTCDGRRIEELRLCLSHALTPRGCGADVLADACRARGALDLPPPR